MLERLYFLKPVPPNIFVQLLCNIFVYFAGVAFLQAGEEMGYEIRDINSEIQTGYSLYQFTMRRGYRCSTAKAFLRPIRLRRNLHVSLWSHVTRVLIDPESKRAYGVEFVRGGKKKTILASREVILSAGAINTPQLLMLSGKKRLWVMQLIFYYIRPVTA